MNNAMELPVLAEGHPVNAYFQEKNPHTEFNEGTGYYRSQDRI